VSDCALCAAHFLSLRIHSVGKAGVWRGRSGRLRHRGDAEAWSYGLLCLSACPRDAAMHLAPAMTRVILFLKATDATAAIRPAVPSLNWSATAITFNRCIY
jgi:hypothetical protein